MKTLATLLLLFTSVLAQAGTLAYWRMGDDTSSVHDSSGNGLALTKYAKGNLPEDSNLPYDGAVVAFHGAGAAFSRTIPLTGATNALAIMNYNSSYLYVADPFTVTNFTVEAYFCPYAYKTSTQYIASHYTVEGSQRSWALGFAASGGTPPAGPNEMFVLLSETGASNPVIPLGLVVTNGVDYYIAFSYDADAAEDDITFRYCDLTNGGSLQTVTATSGYGVLKDSTSPLRIGSYDGNKNNFSGLIDEVRISDRVLGVRELLISWPIPTNTVLTVRQPVDTLQLE
ncbi:MAG: LamG domain-containing protein [Kiritimatiellia bacterium]|jgi:hypothetical protein